jgi:hypothetical protein
MQVRAWVTVTLHGPKRGSVTVFVDGVNTIRVPFVPLRVYPQRKTPASGQAPGAWPTSKEST